MLKSRRSAEQRSEAEHRASSLDTQLLRIVLGGEPDGRFPPLIDGSCEVPFGRGCGRAASAFERGTL